MIEVSVHYLEGLTFIADIKVVEPREKEKGVYVEHVDWRISADPVTRVILKAYGLRRVGTGLVDRTDVYTFYPWGYWQYKAVHQVFRGYWWMVRFLYDNARLFKAIPPQEIFSWGYFTPYVWLKDIVGRIRGLYYHAHL